MKKASSPSNVPSSSSNIEPTPTPTFVPVTPTPTFAPVTPTPTFVPVTPTPTFARYANVCTGDAHSDSDVCTGNANVCARHSDADSNAYPDTEQLIQLRQ